MPLQFEEPNLPVQTTPKSAKLSIRTQNPMAWHDHGNGIPAQRLSNGTRRMGLTDARRYRPIGINLAVGDLRTRRPDTLVEVTGMMQVHLTLELYPFTGEIRRNAFGLT